MTTNMVKGLKKSEKDMSEKETTINVRPLRASKKLSNANGTLVTVGLDSTGKKRAGSIHELLEQMNASTKTKEEKAGEMAIKRWQSKKTAREIYDEFCTETSFTAITRIYKANHLCKRVAWVLVCVLMMTWLTIQCYWLFVKYFSYPIEVKIELIAVPSMTFPSVTICNLNPLKKKHMRREPFDEIADAKLEWDDKETLYDDYLEDLAEEWSESNSTFDIQDEEFMDTLLASREFNKWSILDNNTGTAEKFYSEVDHSFSASFAYSDIAVTISDDEIEKYGHQKKDLIMSCTWAGMQCSPWNFTYQRNNKYGNCYTINSFNNGMEPMTASYAGPLLGLSLELNIEQEEYVSSLSSDAGVRVVVHPRGTFPFPEDTGFSISPGFKTSVGISMTQITRLPPPHSDCGTKGDGVTDIYSENFGTMYSKQTCIKSCYQSAFMSRCGCGFSLYHVPLGTPVCEFGSANKSTCMTESCEDVREECSSKCPSSCNDKVYDYTISTSKWPSEQYERILKNKLEKSSSQFKDQDRLDKVDDTVAKLEIYFKDLIYEDVEQQKAYESENLISDIGGQLGLWLGLSAITIGELIDFIASICRLIASQIAARKEKMAKKGITTVAPLDP